MKYLKISKCQKIYQNHTKNQKLKKFKMSFQEAANEENEKRYHNEK